MLKIKIILATEDNSDGEFKKAVLEKLNSLITKQNQMANELDNLELEVKETTDLQQSAITLLNGLKTKLDEAILAGDMTKVVALRDNLDASNAGLAAAITANTPADPNA